VLRLTPAVISQLQDNQQYSLVFSATSFLGASTQQNATFTKVPSGAMPAVGIVGGSSRKLSIAAGAFVYAASTGWLDRSVQEQGYRPRCPGPSVKMSPCNSTHWAAPSRTALMGITPVWQALHTSWCIWVVHFTIHPQHMNFIRFRRLYSRFVAAHTTIH
jgi:hypothetical protein